MKKYKTVTEVHSNLGNNLQFIYRTIDNNPRYKVVDSQYVQLIDSSITIIVLKKKSFLEILFSL
jgi:hypothetical protein